MMHVHSAAHPGAVIPSETGGYFLNAESTLSVLLSMCKLQLPSVMAKHADAALILLPSESGMSDHLLLISAWSIGVLAGHCQGLHNSCS